MNITSEQIQKWTRITIYMAATALTQHGVAVSGSTKETVAGIAAFLANVAWTLYGGRVIAKLNEIAKLGVVDKVVVNDPAIVAATTEKVVSH